MKCKFIQSMLVALALVTSINFNVVQSVQATTNSTTTSINTETIPAHAEPGTNIKYDNNNNMVILKGKITVADNSTSIDSSLPKPQPGMTVSYDGGGDPVFIKINGETYNENSNSAKKLNRTSSGYKKGPYSNYGAISGYDDIKGQANHDLEEYDCATDKDADNCPLGTRIMVEDCSTGIWGTFNKWDVGNLQGQDEPRIVDVWCTDENYYTLGEIFQLENAKEQGLIHRGYYYHN